MPTTVGILTIMSGKMPTTVGILTIMSGKISYSAELSMTFFHNLGTWTVFIFVHLLNGFQLLKERIFFCRRKFFLLRVDPPLEGFCCPGKQNKKFKKLYPFIKLADKAAIPATLRSKLHIPWPIFAYSYFYLSLYTL